MAWRQTGVGSRYGKVIDDGLSSSNFSWAGGLATLNVAHQFFTWTRTVTNHTAGSSEFQYPKDLGGLMGFDTAAHLLAWEHNQYFLSGKLEALDAECEWHAESGWLYLWAPGGADPTSHCLGKARTRCHLLLRSFR